MSTGTEGPSVPDSECPYDPPDGVCRFCAEDCGHPDCILKLGRAGHRCEHDCWDRHPDTAYVAGQLRSLDGGTPPATSARESS